MMYDAIHALSNRSERSRRGSPPRKRLARWMTTLLFLPLPVFGGSVTCAGAVEVVAYHAGTGMMVKLSSMNVPVFICSPDATWTVPGTPYNTPAGVCKAVYATFLAAKLSGGVVNYIHFDGDQVPSSCTGWANWSMANVRFFAY
jgi:hypothetical protein